MSWFSGIAEKAEAFLDKMDQAAATSLHDAGITPQKKSSVPQQQDQENITSYSDMNQSLPYEPTVHQHHPSTASNMENTNRQGSTVAQILVGSASGAQLLMKPKSTSPTTGTTFTATTTGGNISSAGGVSSRGDSSERSPLSPTSPRPSQKESDDMLFEFLNTPSKTKTKEVSQPKVSSGRSTPRTVTPLNIRLSQQPSLPRPHSSPVMLQPSSSKSRLGASSGGGVEEGGVSGVGGDVVRSDEREVVKSADMGSSRTQWKIGESHIAENIDKDVTLKGLKKSSIVEDTDAPVQLSAIQESTDIPLSMNTDTTPPLEQPPPPPPPDATQDMTNEDGETEASEDHPPPPYSGEREPSLQSQDLQRQQTQSAMDALNQKVSTLELENKLLKREVGSLNDELGSVLSRTKEASDSIAHYESEIHALREQASQTDHMIRQLRSREEDLQATIDSKESQIQVLRTRFSEAEKNLGDFRYQISVSQKEKERLLQDANLSSGAQNHALESLKVKLSQTEASLQQEREKMESTKWEYMKRESELQSEQTQLSEALTAQQRQLSLHQARMAECQSALQSAHSELQSLKREHEEYKQRATGILQAKERLITSLQSEGGVAGGGAASEAKLEEVRLEKEHLTAQLNSAHQQIDTLRTDLQNMDERHHGEVEELVEQVRVCEGVLGEERRLHRATQETLSQMKQEVEMYRDEATREKTALLEQVKTKEVELTELQTKLNSSLGTGKAELESRLHDLTESLIQKQTTLETLNSEKHSLRLQLQRLQDQLAEAQRMQPAKAQTTIVMNGLEQAENTTNESTRIRPMASVLPPIENASTDSQLHKIKRAVNIVDRFSIRLGVFLRRYPHARLFALLYMVLLHIWVMIVLLTYTPEAHGVDGANLHTAM